MSQNKTALKQVEDVLVLVFFVVCFCLCVVWDFFLINSIMQLSKGQE